MSICSRIFLPDIRDFLFFKERTVLSMQDSYDRSFLMKKMVVKNLLTGTVYL